MPAAVSFFEIATGTSSGLTGPSNGLFPLPTDVTLLHVDATMHTAADGPVRASLVLQYDNEVEKRGPIGDGPKWLRSTSSFGVQDSVQWDGEIDFGPRRGSLLVLVRNDTGSAQIVRVARVWRVR